MDNVFTAVIGAVVAVVIIIVLFTFVPTIGSSVEMAQPDISNTSDWNAAHNPDLPNAATMWTSNAALLGVVITVAIIGIAISVLLGLSRPMG